MKMFFLAALAAISLGVGAAQAQSLSHGSAWQRTPSNFMQGGGG